MTPTVTVTATVTQDRTRSTANVDDAKLVELIALRCGLEEDLGVKGKQRVLKSKKKRKTFLADTSHRLRFVYTPRHCSWLNQVEISFSILARRLERRQDAVEHR